MNEGESKETLAVDVRGLSRVFRGKTALHDVNLQIPRGSIFGLVGLNGAGKTTLIRHLIGSFQANTGSVRVLGLDPVKQPQDALAQIGYMTEEDSLPTWMTVGELIDFSRAIRRTWDDTYAADLMDLFGLSRDQKISSLSKGLRARVGLLIAIAYRPTLLILDEPSSGLDPLARRDILEAIIRTVSDEGRTVLFSSHLLDEVDRVCDSFALMRNASIVETMTSEQMQIRYEEVVFQCEGAAEEKEDLFGWQGGEKEWSAVWNRHQGEPLESALPDNARIIARREISLERWFAARAGNKSADPESSTVAGQQETTEASNGFSS